MLSPTHTRNVKPWQDINIPPTCVDHQHKRRFWISADLASENHAVTVGPALCSSSISSS
jgi:hypothetical protein